MATQYEEYLSSIPVVIDNGTGVMKAGLAGEEAPNLVFPTIMGRPKHKKVLPSSVESNFYVGPSDNIRGLMNVSHPITHGIITDLQDMNRIWSHIYSELKLHKKEHSVLLTEPPLNPKSNKHNIAETFFEAFDTPALFIAQQSILSLYAFGKTTGLVVESGDGVTQSIPIYEGYAIQNAVERIDLGGRNITEYLRLLLRRSGYNFVTSSEFEIVKKIKETTAELSENREGFANMVKKEQKKKKQHQYYLPDGTPIELGTEKFYAPEIMFDPSKIGLECKGIHELANASLKKSDLDLRKHLYSEIMLAGGNTEITSFPERMLNELTNLAPRDVKVKIFAPPDRSKAAWMGGSIVSNLGSFKKMWITKKEYKEHGDRIFDMKHF